MTYSDFLSSCQMLGLDFSANSATRPEEMKPNVFSKDSANDANRKKIVWEIVFEKVYNLVSLLVQEHICFSANCQILQFNSLMILVFLKERKVLVLRNSSHSFWFCERPVSDNIEFSVSISPPAHSHVFIPLLFISRKARFSEQRFIKKEKETRHSQHFFPNFQNDFNILTCLIYSL